MTPRRFHGEISLPSASANGMDGITTTQLTHQQAAICNATIGISARSVRHLPSTGCFSSAVVRPQLGVDRVGGCVCLTHLSRDGRWLSGRGPDLISSEEFLLTTGRREVHGTKCLLRCPANAFRSRPTPYFCSARFGNASLRETSLSVLGLIRRRSRVGNGESRSAPYTSRPRFVRFSRTAASRVSLLRALPL